MSGRILARVTVTAPASTSNLGPGFDCLGLALGLRNELTLELHDAAGPSLVEIEGAGADTLPRGEHNMLVHAARQALPTGLPGRLVFKARNRVPLARGLGSSAAAIVTGVLAARGLVSEGATRLPDEAVFRLAVDLEGHPDNVAACLAGGLTIAWTDQPGPGSPAVPKLAKLAVLDGISPVVCVPQDVLSTETARRVLPETVPHADAAANAGRSALLIAGLTGLPEVLFDATEDFLHQRYRAAVMPATADLLHRLRAAGLAAVVSGAGPALLVLTGPGPNSAPDLVDSIARETGIAWRISPLDVDRQGATLQTAVPGVRP